MSPKNTECSTVCFFPFILYFSVSFFRPSKRDPLPWPNCLLDSLAKKTRHKLPSAFDFRLSLSLSLSSQPQTRWLCACVCLYVCAHITVLIIFHLSSHRENNYSIPCKRRSRKNVDAERNEEADEKRRK